MQNIYAMFYAKSTYSGINLKEVDMNKSVIIFFGIILCAVFSYGMQEQSDKEKTKSEKYLELSNEEKERLAAQLLFNLYSVNKKPKDDCTYPITPQAN